MFLLMPMSLMTSLNSIVPVLLVFMSLVQTNLYFTPFSNKAIVAYNVVKIPIERKELFFYTSHATTSALEIRCNFAARNVSPCPSLFDRQNHKYLNIKVRVCMQTQQNLKNKYKCRKAAKL